MLPTTTTFLSANDVVALIRQHGFDRFLRDLLSWIQEDFLRWDDFQKSARTANHLDNVGVVELMPVSDREAFGFKYVNGHPYNHEHAYPTVMAFGVYSEMKTGVPLLLSDLTIPTAWRTAATSALAATVMAKKESRSMAIIGNGAQAAFQAFAFWKVLGIQHFNLYDPDASAMHGLRSHLLSWGVDVKVFSSVREAIEGVDIITTVTADKRKNTIIENEWIQGGVHINAVGGDCPGKTELDMELVRRSTVVVEYEPQTRIEGEIQQLESSFTVLHLHKILQTRTHARLADDQITIFDSVGFALEDFSILRGLYALSQQYGMGQKIALVANAKNPKDLWASSL
jgi:ornithine cyclodeaminase